MLEIEKQAAELRQRLEANPEFTKIPEKRRRSLLKGENPYLSSLEDIAEGIGIEKATYRWLNKIFSNHVHSYPFSFYRMREENLSRGERSPSEESNIRLCISTSLLALVTARDAMESLFAGLTQDPEYLAAISKATKPQ